VNDAARLGRRQRRRWLHRLALGAGASILALGLVRTFVGWVFPVASGSMWPTLDVGEWVFLRWDRSLPQRFDLVAFRSESGDALVKRVWGLPGEPVLIEPSGDVRVRSELVRGAGRPALVKVYDSRLHPVEDHWSHGGTEVDPWRRLELPDDGVVWEIDSREVPERLDACLLRHHKGVHDDRLAPDGTIRYGSVTVHDLCLSADVFVVEGGGRLRFELREQGDRIEFSLDLPQESGPSSGVVRRSRGSAHVEHARATFEVPIGRWFRVRFQNIDDEISATLDEQPPVTCVYRQNTPHERVMAGDGRVDLEVVSLGERAYLGADRAQVRFRGIVLQRDIHVPAAGAYGVGRELKLGPDDFYVLGDDPTRSRDSRALGPISTTRLIGRPAAVVWPPRAWRRL